MEVTTLKRVFKYNGMNLLDPGSHLSPDGVREFHAICYPELLVAVVEGPVTKGTTSTYTFIKAVGSKGREQSPLEATRCVLIAAMQKDIPVLPGGEQSAGSNILEVCQQTEGARLPLPCSAYGIHG